jgi:hypothetical protein
MSTIYVDDSTRSVAGFVLCAAVVAPDGIEELVARALIAAGITPGEGEYKSGARMHGRENLVELKHTLNGILSSHCSVGIVVAPAQASARVGPLVVDGIAHIIRANSLEADVTSAFLDQGMFRSLEEARANWSAKPDLCKISLHAEQDSRNVLGIQLADAAAHVCGSMLQDRLVPSGKTVKAGENSGYDPDDDLELGFALWGALRYAFFRGGPVHPDGDPALADATSGLFIAPQCSADLTAAAIQRFGSVYMGCIH